MIRHETMFFFFCSHLIGFTNGRIYADESCEYFQRQPPRGVLRKRCSEYMQQIYRRTPMPKCVSIKLLCNFIEITLWYGWSPVNLLHIFRTPLTKNTSVWLLLYFQSSRKKNVSKKKNGN